jgi:hypothetical protein
MQHAQDNERVCQWVAWGVESGVLCDLNLRIKEIPTPEGLDTITSQAQPEWK